MMELVLIYLWLKIDSIIISFGVILVLSSIAFFAISIFLLEGGYTEDDEVFPKLTKLRRSSSVLASIALAICVFVPSAKDIAILVGASYALDMAKSPEGQKVQSLIRSKANEMLDEELGKLKEKKK